MGVKYKLIHLLFVIFIVLMVADRGKSKKTIKIHVPYYVKHIHHYKKVYVPKVQVIKHEHHHKKEHDHHHHHHDHGHSHGHEHYHSYEKFGNDYKEDSSHYDSYYDELDSRTYITGKRPLRRGKYGHQTNLQYKSWGDSEGSEYRGDESGEESDDEYSEVQEPLRSKTRVRPKNVIVPIYRKRITPVRRSDPMGNETAIQEGAR